MQNCDTLLIPPARSAAAVASRLNVDTGGPPVMFTSLIGIPTRGLISYLPSLCWALVRPLRERPKSAESGRKGPLSATLTLVVTYNTPPE